MTTNHQNHDETQRRLAIYKRPGAEAAQAPQFQSLDLEAWAREQGFTDITVFAERYIPGDTPLAHRDAFMAMKQAIEGEEPDQANYAQRYVFKEHKQTVAEQEDEEASTLSQKPFTAILVASVNRLFRGRMLEDVALFVNLCSSHGIVVLTPTEQYDFRNENDVVKFCFSCMAASGDIERVTLTRMQAGKRAAAARRRASSTN
jgi:Resolvase, N terminal domain